MDIAQCCPRTVLHNKMKLHLFDTIGYIVQPFSVNLLKPSGNFTYDQV
jgi:hypothetical protein